MTSISSPTFKFVVLAILDGWGIAPDSPGNAISKASTLNMDRFWAAYPHTQLEAAGEGVGLPRGEDGNTETGHLNLGAGRIVYQDLQRINMAIADGSFFKNKVLLDSISHAKKNNSKLHLMGLIGAGGVHSNIEHLFALVRLCGQQKFEKVYIHLFTDGRDSPPTAAKDYIKRLRTVLANEKIGEIASVMGRYWAMDRDQRWDRTAKAYVALTKGIGNLVKTPEEVIEASYQEAKTDEFIDPSLIMGGNSKPVALIEGNDSVVFFNFRIDRPRQLSYAFVMDDLSKARVSYEADRISLTSKDDLKKPVSSDPFDRGKKIPNLFFVTLTEYSKSLSSEGASVAYPPEVVDIPLSGAIANIGLKQLKITESEKERFVTFYLNGLREKPFVLEDKIIIPSAKVPTYDQKPEMEARKITETLLARMGSSAYNFVVVNYPNADMVAHTGNIGATVKAVEVVDEAIGKLANFVLAYQGVLVITADHGNAEEMINLHTGDIDTEHSRNKVPFIAIANELLSKNLTLSSGILGDVAPTILPLIGVQTPSQMTGRNLLSGIFRL